MAAGSKPAQAWEAVVQLRQQHGITAFDHVPATGRNQSLAASIAITLDQFSQADRDRYYRLSRFAEAVSLEEIAAAWSASVQQAMPLVERLVDVGLLEIVSASGTQYRLPALLHSYVVDQELVPQAEAPPPPTVLPYPADQPNPNITRARQILRGTYVPPADVFQLARRLKNEKLFYLAWPILARARRDPELLKQDIPPLRFAQLQALCTYKDVNLPAEQRYARALEILEKDCDLAHSTDPETLGLAGAVHKYRWQWDGQRRHLERSLSYYLKGHEHASRNDPKYDGYPGINAAFLLDLLANLEDVEARAAGTMSATAAEHRALARAIRQQLVSHLTELEQQPVNQKLQSQWWFLVTLAEAYFGLQQYDAATVWLRRAHQLPSVPDWEVESTVRQLAALARLQEEAAAPAPASKPALQPWTVFKDALDVSTVARAWRCSARSVCALRRRLPRGLVSHRGARPAGRAGHAPACRGAIVRLRGSYHRRALLPRGSQAPAQQA